MDADGCPRVAAGAYLFQRSRSSPRLIHRAERLHRRIHRLHAPFSTRRARLVTTPGGAPSMTRVSAEFGRARASHQISGAGVFDEGCCPFRVGARHRLPGECRTNLRYELAWPNVSLSRAVLSPGMAIARYCAGRRRVRRLEEGWSTQLTCSSKGHFVEGRLLSGGVEYSHRPFVTRFATRGSRVARPLLR
jgi:hypothetical protein